MFDMSWGEVMVIGGVALIVIGPKDLPKALRTVGQMTTRVRKLAAEFQGQFNEAMREAELDDVRREMEGINRQVTSGVGGFNPIQTIRDELKSAVEKPTTASPPLYEPTPPPLPPGENLATVSSLPAEPVEEAGPIHHIEPIVAEEPLPPRRNAAPVEAAGPGLEGAGEISPRASGERA